jgi:hypothetical protein
VGKVFNTFLIVGAFFWVYIYTKLAGGIKFQMQHILKKAAIPNYTRYANFAQILHRTTV